MEWKWVRRGCRASLKKALHKNNYHITSLIFLLSWQGFCVDLSRTYMACVSGEFCQAQHLTSVEKWIGRPLRDYATQKPPWFPARKKLLTLPKAPLPGILRSPWPDCPALSQPIRTFAFHFLLEQPITNSSPEWGKLIGWLLDSLSIFFLFSFNFFFGFVLIHFFFFFTSWSTVD